MLLLDQTDNNAKPDDPEISNWSLLPSYHMYKSIVQKSLRIVNLTPPPPYELTNSTFNHVSSNTSSTSSILLNNIGTLKPLGLVEFDIVFTKNKNEIAKGSQVIGDIEYKQNDDVYGYILLKNLKDHKICFDIFYILLEGILKIDSSEKTFLSMIDFDASMNVLKIDEHDEHDNSYYLNSNEILPGKVYKKFFSFKIPEYLLDINCKQIKQHLNLPPTFQAKTDLGLINASIKYTVRGFLISDNSKEYLNIGSITTPIRVIPMYKTADKEFYNYDFLINQLKQELVWNNKLKFDSLLNNLILKDSEHMLIYKKNNLITEILDSKVNIKYVPPKWNHVDLNQEVKLFIKFTGKRLPQIRKITAELVAVTIASISPSPIEITHNMLYRNYTTKTFSDLVIKPIKKLKSELSRSSLTLPNQLAVALKKLANLTVKYSTLSIDNTTYKESTFECDKVLDINFNLKSMYIKDLDKAIKANRFGGFCLIPNFQSCHLSRLYYTKIIIAIDVTSPIMIHIPVEIS